MGITCKVKESMTRNEEREFICDCNTDIRERLAALTLHRHSIEMSLGFIMEELPEFVDTDLREAIYMNCIGKWFKMDKKFIIKNLKDLEWEGYGI